MSNDLGLDRSGNGNNWTVNNITFADQMLDSPTNNFATQNPLHIHTDGSPTFSEGNLRIVTALTPAGRNASTIGVLSGKYYAEMYHEAGVSGSWVAPRTVVGITTNAVDTIRGANGGNIGNLTTSEDVGYAGQDGRKNVGNSWSSYGASWAIGDIIGVALNMDDNEVTFYKNNVSQGAISFTASSEGHFVCGDTSGGGGLTAVWNYGQDSSFAGNKTAQGNQDGNSIGDFYYTPPSGFLALCTQNLPDVAVTPSEHFNTILWTGNDADGSTTQTLTGVGFQPDFVWVKQRSNAANHHLTDAVRGVSQRLVSNDTQAEGDMGSGQGVWSFDSDGFKVGNRYYGVNDNTYTYVAWNWKANGSGSANTAGTINSTVSANVDAGFSIVSYTGNGTAGSTVGHGLSKAPDMIISKSRDSAEDWGVYTRALGGTSSLFLNRTLASESGLADWHNTDPSSTLITLGYGAETNISGDDFIQYVFHSVDGYSKVGSYEGNDSADGTFVYTGFRPAFVIVKNIDDSGMSWIMADTAREPTNVMANELYPNLSNAEYVSSGERWDFLSNGFKLRSGSAVTNEDTLIYIAFAETPFKYSNAR
jgi:hypothetical protein